MSMTNELKGRLKAVSFPLLLLSAVGCALLITRFFVSGNTRYWFLPWNLILAWVPFLLGFVVVQAGKRFRWTSWQFILSAAAWLFFLPNAFYIVTDLIHIHNTGEVSIVYDVVMMMVFIIAGNLLGFVSLLMIEQELRRGLSKRVTVGVIGVIILLSSFAIYLGRYLRWNSWDVLVNPGGLLLDTADRLIHPFEHPLVITTTLLFFIVISTLYYSLRLFVRAMKKFI